MAERRHRRSKTKGYAQCRGLPKQREPIPRHAEAGVLFLRRCQISHSRFNEKAAWRELCRIIRHLGSGNQIDAAMIFARADFVSVL